MKIKKFALLLCLALCACCLPANASSLGDIRVNARFLTDRMAFELNLNQSQYNDLFEINFDFLSGVETLKGWIEDYESSRFTAIDSHTAVITSEYNMECVKTWLERNTPIAEKTEF